MEFRPQFQHRKTKGDFAEMVFMAKATTLGLTLCKPYGENHRYDFLVDVHLRRVLRVQIKSSWTRRYGGVYQFKLSGSGRPYRPGEVHYIVVYVVPVDAWYVIPARVVRGRDVGVVFPDTPNSRGQFEKYRDAWHLILGRKRSIRVDIQACADPAYDEAVA